MVCRTPPHYYGAQWTAKEAPWRRQVEEALQQAAVDQSLREESLRDHTSTPGAASSMDPLTAAVFDQRDVPREEINRLGHLGRKSLGV